MRATLALNGLMKMTSLVVTETGMEARLLAILEMILVIILNFIFHNDIEKICLKYYCQTLNQW